MDLIHLITVFIAVGEEECLAAAARRLDLSPAAVTRAVSALETRLETTLLLRMTRTVRLTDAGRQHLASMKQIMGALEQADRNVSGVNGHHKGRLSVAAPIAFGQTFVLPCIAAYMEQFPQLDVAACFVDRPVNIVDEGQDVAVRVGRLPDSGLRSVQVGQVRSVLVASPDYLAEHGQPRRPAELAQHAVISHHDLVPRGDVLSLAHLSVPSSRARPRLSVSGANAAIDAALAGLGIARVMLFQVAAHIEAGRLQLVLQEHEGPAQPVQLLHRQGRYGSSKVRQFIDLTVARLRAEKSLH